MMADLTPLERERVARAIGLAEAVARVPTVALGVRSVTREIAELLRPLLDIQENQ